MDANERRLLYNVLDSLDRLYDRDCGLWDVRDLCTATASAVSEAHWVAALEEAAAGLAEIMRSGLPAQQEYEQALLRTDALRLKLAAFYEG